MKTAPEHITGGRWPAALLPALVVSGLSVVLHTPLWPADEQPAGPQATAAQTGDGAAADLQPAAGVNGFSPAHRTNLPPGPPGIANREVLATPAQGVLAEHLKPALQLSMPVIFSGAYSYYAINNEKIRDTVSENKKGFWADADLFTTDAGSGSYLVFFMAYQLGWLIDRLLVDSGFMPGFDNYHHQSTLYLFKALIYGAVAVQLLKFSVGRKRPFVSDSAPDFKRFQLETPDFYSFPSGHTLTSFGIMAVAARRYGFGWIFLPIAGYAAYTRVTLKKHFFTDIYFSGILTMAVTKAFVPGSHTFFPEMEVVTLAENRGRYSKTRAAFDLDVVTYLTFYQSDLDEVLSL